MSNIVASIISKMIEYFEGDNRRINHALKVYAFAKNIGELESLSNEKLEILEIAAVLHDIGIKESERKYSTSAGKYQEIEGPPVAADILKEFNLDKETLDRICYLIGNHHSYSKIDDIAFQILVEADFLVNIFEDNIKTDQIKSIKEKYFRTNIGISYLDSMYVE